MSAVLQTLAAELGTSDRTLRRALNDGLIRGARPSAYKVDLSLAERTYLRRHWELISDLRAGLRLESVECAVLFGSMARGDGGLDSDVDVMVWRRSGASRLAIARRLSRRVGRHVQVLDAADVERQPGLALSVLRDGRPLVDRAGRWRELAARRERLRRAAARERRVTAEKAAGARAYFRAVIADSGGSAGDVVGDPGGPDIAGGPLTLRPMAARASTIRLAPDAYELLRREAERRGVETDALAEQLLRADLQPDDGWERLDETLAVLADLRGRLPEIDGVDLANQARADLEARG